MMFVWNKCPNMDTGQTLQCVTVYMSCVFPFILWYNGKYAFGQHADMINKLLSVLSFSYIKHYHNTTIYSL